MTPIDFAKAAGLGVLLVIVNLLILVVIVFAYAQLIEPGHPNGYYNPVAVRIGAWSGPIGGAVLLFSAAYVMARRRPQRNALAFAGVLWAAYAAVDVALGAPMAGLAALFTPLLAFSLGLALAGALAGAYLAARRRAAVAA